ncbi:MAG TPA: hypothetical protein VFD85_08275, partial [Gemmatimonadales bacterium]|nr:hypothetical protein [Gemmatimonadales bacterium]
QTSGGTVYAGLVAILMLLQPAAPSATAGCVIVVNDANPFYSASAGQVADLFLAKRATWTNGSAVTPVDQMPEAEVREEFSVAILGRPLQAVQAYWRAKVYREDVTPPQELGSDQAVIDFVKTHPNAIGYVTPDVELPAGVHAVVVMK